MESRIGKRVFAARRTAGLTQEQLAEAAQIDVTTVRRIEACQQAPRDDVLTRIAEVTGVAVDVLRNNGPGDGEFTRLDRFPLGFAPVSIVIGDRKEQDPDSPGDLLAFSGSPCDLTFLMSLDLPGDTEIVSDKVFARCSQDDLRRRFAHKHLLVIGSPATNYLARKVNQQAVFRFPVPRWASEKLAEIERDINGPDALSNFLKQDTREKRRKELRKALLDCRRGGIVDPTAYGNYLHGMFPVDNRDWGMITLAPHPYAEPGDIKPLALMVAGAHLPATMHGLRMLASRRGKDWPLPTDTFRDHPVGGVFVVKLDRQKSWEKKLFEVDGIEWETEAYREPSELIQHFADMAKAKRQESLSKDEIEQICEFLKKLE